MSSLLLTAPVVEPLSLDEAKAFLQVEHNDDDDVIAALAAGSRIHIETQTRRALITQSWRGVTAFNGAGGDGSSVIWPAIGWVTAYFGGRSLEKVAGILGRK